MTLLLALLLLASPEKAPSLLEQINKLSRTLHKQEGRLQKLEARKHQLELEVADLQAEIATNQLKLSTINKLLRQRLISLAKMPNGTRLAVLEGADSLQEFLQTRKTLRIIARHDRDLRNRKREHQTTLRGLLENVEKKQGELLDSQEEFLLQREQVTEKRGTKLRFLQKILNNRNQSDQLALEFLHANSRLTETIGTLVPGDRGGRRFRSNRGELPWPTLGTLDKEFGKTLEEESSTTTYNQGISLRTPYGTDVYAIYEGTVAFADWQPGYGQVIILDHQRGYHSVVAHLKEIKVKVGQPVSQLQLIGTVGDTGSTEGTQLYFEIRKNGRPQDPQDWLRSTPTNKK